MFFWLVTQSFLQNVVLWDSSLTHRTIWGLLNGIVCQQPCSFATTWLSILGRTHSPNLWLLLVVVSKTCMTRSGRAVRAFLRLDLWGRYYLMVYDLKIKSSYQLLQLDNYVIFFTVFWLTLLVEVLRIHVIYTSILVRSTPKTDWRAEVKEIRVMMQEFSL